MVRQTGKQHTSATARLVFLCVGLLGFGLIADLFWASSSSSAAFNPSLSLSFPNNWSLISSNDPLIPDPIGHGDKNLKEKSKDGRVLSATFADLPGPQLKWEKMSASPVPRLDGAAIQIKDLLFVFAGYGTIDLVHSHVDVYNFTDNTWGGRFDMPKEMAHSHLGMVTDGRYIYVVTGGKTKKFI